MKKQLNTFSHYNVIVISELVHFMKYFVFQFEEPLREVKSSRKQNLSNSKGDDYANPTFDDTEDNFVEAARIILRGLTTGKNVISLYECI